MRSFDRDKEILYFLHIPKCAGTTFRVYLENAFHAREICPAYDFYSLTRLSRNKLKRFKLFRGHMGYNLVNFLEVRPYIVTFLRDPVERALSHFDYIRRDPAHPKFKIINERKLDLRSFLADRTLSSELENFQTKALAHDVNRDDLLKAANESQDAQAFQRNLQKLKTNLGKRKMLELALRRLSEIEFVGIVEKFEESLRLASYLLGIKPHSQLQALNVRYERNEIPNEILDLISERNDLDYELYASASSKFEDDFREMIRTLIDRRYAESLSKTVKPVSTIDFDFSGPISGTGWHQREKHPDRGFFRWTGPGRNASLDLKLLNGNDYDIAIEVCGYVLRVLVSELRVYVNGTPLHLAMSERDGVHVFRGVIPKDLLTRKMTRLRLQTGKTLEEPRAEELSIDHNLRRKVGLAVSNITVTGRNWGAARQRAGSDNPNASGRRNDFRDGCTGTGKRVQESSDKA